MKAIPGARVSHPKPLLGYEGMCTVTLSSFGASFPYRVYLCTSAEREVQHTERNHPVLTVLRQ